MKVLHLDVNHPSLWEELKALGFENEDDYTSSKEDIEARIHLYDGIIIRSRFNIDASFLHKATQLKFIGRVGAGLENIDCDTARERGVFLAAAPEGNRNAVGEHTLGMLLALFNKLCSGNQEVRKGIWDREGNRGLELDGKTVGIIGYGNSGKAFARKLAGFDVNVLCYDILENMGNAHAKQVDLNELQQNADVLSLHVPQTPQTIGMVNSHFISKCIKPFWLLNTSRGKCVITADLVDALKNGTILGAGLDVLEYEKTSFESLFNLSESESAASHLPEEFKYLIEADNVLLTPHVAGWTVESKEKLALTLVKKIKDRFC